MHTIIRNAHCSTGHVCRCLLSCRYVDGCSCCFDQQYATELHIPILYVRGVIGHDGRIPASGMILVFTCIYVSMYPCMYNIHTMLYILYVIKLDCRQHGSAKQSSCRLPCLPDYSFCKPRLVVISTLACYTYVISS